MRLTFTGQKAPLSLNWRHIFPCCTWTEVDQIWDYKSNKRLRHCFTFKKKQNRSHAFNKMFKHNKLWEWANTTKHYIIYLETRKDYNRWEAAKAIVSMWTGCQRKAMLGFLSCSFLMIRWWHALTSSSGSFPCCAWLFTSAAAWRETHTVPFTWCGYHRGNVLRISFRSRKYYHSCGC